MERTDGIPLFVEEMTKAVLEAESEGAARRTVAAVPSPALAVPASLHASLMARLDRLGPASRLGFRGGIALTWMIVHLLPNGPFGITNCLVICDVRCLGQSGLQRTFTQLLDPSRTFTNC
jgi:hypothetical protein